MVRFGFGLLATPAACDLQKISRQGASLEESSAALRAAPSSTGWVRPGMRSGEIFPDSGAGALSPIIRTGGSSPCSTSHFVGLTYIDVFRFGKKRSWDLARGPQPHRILGSIPLRIQPIFRMTTNRRCGPTIE